MFCNFYSICVQGFPCLIFQLLPQSAVQEHADLVWEVDTDQIWIGGKHSQHTDIYWSLFGILSLNMELIYLCAFTKLSFSFVIYFCICHGKNSSLVEFKIILVESPIGLPRFGYCPRVQNLINAVAEA